MEIGEVSGFYKFVKPVSLSDIILDVEESTKDFIMFRIHCKYDTQATADEIIEKLKRLDELEYRMTDIQAEMMRTVILIDSTEECYQEPIKAYLDGLNKAWSILDGNK